MTVRTYCDSLSEQSKSLRALIETGALPLWPPDVIRTRRNGQKIDTLNDIGLVLAEAKDYEIQSCGKGDSENSRLVSAVLEVIERASIYASSDRKISCYSDVSDVAINPMLQGIPINQHGPEDWVPYHPDTSVEWMDVTSLVTQRRYLCHSPFASTGFWVETTSGVAAGFSVDRAIKNAIFELVERDAVIKAWHFRLPPLAKIRFAHHSNLDNCFKFLRGVGFETEIYRLDSFGAIPVALAVSRQISEASVFFPIGSTVCGSASSCSVHDASLSATQEVVQWVENLLFHGQKKMRQDKGTGADFYANFDSAKNFDFLDRGCSASELNIPELDQSIGLQHLVDVLYSNGVEPYFADLTPSWAECHGIKVVRAFAPGLHCLTLGFDDPGWIRAISDTDGAMPEACTLNDDPLPL